MRVLIFGRTGQLGHELARAVWKPNATIIQLGHEQADFSRPELLPAIVSQAKPNLVVIAAAYTSVDRAEREPELAMTVNASAPEAIARAATTVGAPVMHVSTDYVFDGTSARPYVEDDPVAPLGVYGRSKEFGERAVRGANPHHVILRTAWVYSAVGTNFVKTMIRLAQERDKVSVVGDQFGCPTAAKELAAAIAAMAPRVVEDPSTSGTYHAVGTDSTSWHGFAEAIFCELERRGHRRPINQLIPTSEYPTPARRPANSRLDSSKLNRVFGLRLKPFGIALPPVVDDVFRL